jgi:hypothetical protein
MPEKHHIIPVWFFVGLLFLMYGCLIFASGLAGWTEGRGVVLAELHAPVWWGALLVLMGCLYVAMFRPKGGG